MIVDSSSISGIFNFSIITLGVSLFTNAYTFVSSLSEKLDTCVSYYNNIGLLYKPPKEIDKLKRCNLLSLVSRSRVYCTALVIFFVIMSGIALMCTPMLEGYVISIQFDGVYIVDEPDENNKSSAQTKGGTEQSKDEEDQSEQTTNNPLPNNEETIKFLICARFIIAILLLVNCTLLLVNILKVQRLQILLLKAYQQMQRKSNHS